MGMFNVYPLNDVTPVKALGSKVWDKNGVEYLDLYGGHAVISIGHSHPHYVSKISDQLSKIGFYSNSVHIPLQQELASKILQVSGLANYSLFLANSGAEANENALKLASFHTGRKNVIAFTNGFHGRTSAAVAVTSNPNIKSLLNDDTHVTFLPFNDSEAVKNTIDEHTAAVIVEGIQGIGGIHVATDDFMHTIRQKCNETGAVFIHDSVQCGFGRSGKFFTFQHSGVLPDIISMAKGMGNGFPVGGILISDTFEAKFGMLGTTFGGNHLACAASLAVLEVIEKENLIHNAQQVGDYALNELNKLPNIKEVRGQGLMIGIELEKPIADMRKSLLFADKIFTGVAGKHTIRLLPSLACTKDDIDRFISCFQKYL